MYFFSIFFLFRSPFCVREKNRENKKHNKGVWEDCEHICKLLYSVGLMYWALRNLAAIFGPLFSLLAIVGHSNRVKATYII